MSFVLQMEAGEGATTAINLLEQEKVVAVVKVSNIYTCVHIICLL